MSGCIEHSSVPEAERRGLLQELFSGLDAEKIGAEYLRAAESGDEKSRIAAIAKYYRTRAPKPAGAWKMPDPDFRKTADRAVRGEMNEVSIPWTFPGGRIDWRFNPTFDHPPCNHEWLWQLNRMSFWTDMAAAYRETGDEKYAAAFDAQLESWLATAGSPPSADWNKPGSLWRTIETGLRMMNSWNQAFEVFRTSPSFSDENLCLMLGSMCRHARHLREHHRPRTNWLLMEMSGLYTFAVNFPEFKSASAMRSYAAKVFGSAFSSQILPDGMYDELSPDYHLVLLGCVLTFLDIGGKDAAEKDLPPGFLAKMESNFNAIVQMITPAMTMPRTNDTYTVATDRNLRGAVDLFPHRKDFRWAFTKRKEGAPPDSSPTASRFLP